MLKKPLILLTILSLLSINLSKEIPLEKLFPQKETGLINLSNKNSLFYILARAKNLKPNTPLAVWLNGGPGCSSLMGYFGENGPYKHTPNSDDSSPLFTENIHSWNENANIQYVEQPFGVGFSELNNQEDFPADFFRNGDIFIEFLKKFVMEKYPEFIGRDFYLTGESMGGQFIAGISYQLMDQFDKEEERFINFKGVAVDSGWINPMSFYGTYGSFAYSRNLIGFWHYVKTIPYTFQCQVYMKLMPENQLTLDICYHLTDVVVGKPRNFDWYDTSYQKPKDSIKDAQSYDWRYLNRFLNSNEVKTYFNQYLGIDITNKKWMRCSRQVRKNQSFKSQQSVKFVYDKLLDRKYKVSFRTGLDDMVCNVDGMMQWVKTLKVFDRSLYELKYLGNEGDWVFEMGNFLKVWGIANAGHMIPIKRGDREKEAFEDLISKQQV